MHNLLWGLSDLLEVMIVAFLADGILTCHGRKRCRCKQHTEWLNPFQGPGIVSADSDENGVESCSIY